MGLDWDTVKLEWSDKVPFTKENAMKYNEKGVYRIMDSDENIVYIGSAYLRPIKKRLVQYFIRKDTGNTLLKQLKNKMRDDEIDKYYSTLYVSVYEYEDLESYLINKFKPIYNNKGKEK